MKKTILAAFAVLLAGTSASFAVEKLKVAIPQRGFWDSSWVEFGETAGYFKDAGLEVEVFYTDGGAQTIATVASGSVDIAMSNGILGAIGAYV
jgi:NitT/TauT family transport system substrate-binding protein